jgi:hypothetical protein
MVDWSRSSAAKMSAILALAAVEGVLEEEPLLLE